MAVDGSGAMTAALNERGVEACVLRAATGAFGGKSWMRADVEMGGRVVHDFAVCEGDPAAALADQLGRRR